MKSQDKRTISKTIKLSQTELTAIKTLKTKELPDLPLSTYIRSKMVSLTK